MTAAESANLAVTNSPGTGGGHPAIGPLLQAIWQTGAAPQDQPANALGGGARLWRSLARGTLDLLYPPRCPLTGEDLAAAVNPWLSATALARLPALADPLCPRCSAPTTGAPEGSATGSSPRGCRLCATSEGRFTQAVCLWEYEGLGRDLILAFKFGGERQLVDLLGRWLYGVGRARDLFVGVRRIAAAPGSQHIGRAFLQEDHAQALAESVVAADRRAAMPLGLELLHPGLEKIRRTAPQATLPLAERLAGPAESMLCAATALPEETVVVVDDVLTTLATATEATRALLAAGAREVRLLALARTL